MVIRALSSSLFALEIGTVPMRMMDQELTLPLPLPLPNTDLEGIFFLLGATTILQRPKSPPHSCSAQPLARPA